MQEALQLFEKHYQERFRNHDHPVLLEEKKMPDDKGVMYTLSCENMLKPDNGPRIFYHGTTDRDVIVLTHGLSDSPYYVSDVARRFYEAGCNVVMPLLPAHGLIHPDDAMEDRTLDVKWRAAIDHAVDCARLLGNRVSIGGFSTGGALSLNKILRDEASVDGGLFLFSAALSIGKLMEAAGRLEFLQTIALIKDGFLKGIGPDPYKYPVLPEAAGFELIQIINENNELSEGRKIPQPTFAAHSAHDFTAKFEGILHFMGHHVENGIALLIAEKEKVEHSCLLLEKGIRLDHRHKPAPLYEPKANPKFDWMMGEAVRFFREEVEPMDQK